MTIQPLNAESKKPNWKNWTQDSQLRVYALNAWFEMGLGGPHGDIRPSEDRMYAQNLAQLIDQGLAASPLVYEGELGPRPGIRLLFGAWQGTADREALKEMGPEPTLDFVPVAEELLNLLRAFAKGEELKAGELSRLREFCTRLMFEASDIQSRRLQGL